MTAFLIANMAPLMFAALVVFLLLGYPVAFALAANGIVFGLIGIELGLLQPSLFGAMPERLWGVMSNDTLLAIPFFTFMGLILERSGMAEDLLDTIGQLFGPIRGGLAYAVIFVGALLAATTGVVAASVISMGLISLPIMLRYGYDRRIASGTIAASGTLAQIIPPSLVLIIMADQLGRSVGDMYAGAFIPGIVLAGLYAGFILLMSFVKPEWVPALPEEARTIREPDGSSGNALADRAHGHCRRRRRRVLVPLLQPVQARRRDRRADRDLRQRRRSAVAFFAAVVNRVTEAGPAVADRRAGDVRADPAARADLPRARHDLPGRGDADRRRRDGRVRRAHHGGRAAAPRLEAAEAGDGVDGQADRVRRLHPGRRARVQPDVLRRRRPQVGRAPAVGPARRRSSAS